jgi:hypothetical protein
LAAQFAELLPLVAVALIMRISGFAMAPSRSLRLGALGLLQAVQEINGTLRMRGGGE